jgi:hypothetical protein
MLAVRIHGPAFAAQGAPEDSVAAPEPLQGNDASRDMARNGTLENRRGRAAIFLRRNQGEARESQ